MQSRDYILSVRRSTLFLKQNVETKEVNTFHVHQTNIQKLHAFLVLIGCLYFPTPGHGPSPWPHFPGRGPQFVFTSLGSQFVLTGAGRDLYLPALAPNFYLPALASKLHLPVLAPNLYSPALIYNFITIPGPDFAYTNLVSSICICIYGPGLRFVFTGRSLNMHLPYCW